MSDSDNMEMTTPSEGESSGQDLSSDINESAVKADAEHSDEAAPKEKERRGRRGHSESSSGEPSARPPRYRKKVCAFCHDKKLPLDYKRPDILVRFVTDRGKILPRRVTGTCAKHQRHLAREIKRARIIAYLPFVEQ